MLLCGNQSYVPFMNILHFKNKNIWHTTVQKVCGRYNSVMHWFLVRSVRFLKEDSYVYVYQGCVLYFIIF